MARDENLDLVGNAGANVEHHPAQQLREHLVGQLRPVLTANQALLSGQPSTPPEPTCPPSPGGGRIFRTTTEHARQAAHL
jgi:hypothetical protein